MFPPTFFLFNNFPSLNAIYLDSTAMRSPVCNEPPSIFDLYSFQSSADIISCIRNTCFPCAVGVNHICVFLVNFKFLSVSIRVIKPGTELKVTFVSECMHSDCIQMHLQEGSFFNLIIVLLCYLSTR